MENVYHEKLCIYFQNSLFQDKLTFQFCFSINFQKSSLDAKPYQYLLLEIIG